MKKGEKKVDVEVVEKCKIYERKKESEIHKKRSNRRGRERHKARLTTL